MESKVLDRRHKPAREPYLTEQARHNESQGSCPGTNELLVVVKQ